VAVLSKRGLISAALLVAVLLALASVSDAQFRRGAIGLGIRMATPQSFDGKFSFCRAAFRGNRFGDGGGWGVDYPRADINVSIRLSELTKTQVGVDPTGEPNHLVVRLTDQELFQCPFVMMTEVGSAFFDDTEAAQLRQYLLKGGFLWADDFWGSYAWQAWVEQIRRVLPGNDYPIIDLPPDHPLFSTHLGLRKTPQIPSINFWAGSGGSTSERGADSAEPHARAIVDRHERILVLMTHNTDIGDSWEREGDDPQYFLTFSVDGYAFGLNVLIYAMTH
jgi:hypothetical protein